MAVTDIERLEPRDGIREWPHKTAKGYKLAPPGLGTGRNKSENAIYVSSLDKAADLLGKGYCLWMTQAGKRPALITPESLRVIRSSSEKEAA